MSSLVISWICNAVLFVCCCIICRCFRKQVKLNGELLEKNKHDKQMWKENYFDSEAAYERKRKELEMEYGEKLSALTNDAVTTYPLKRASWTGLPTGLLRLCWSVCRLEYRLRLCWV